MTLGVATTTPQPVPTVGAAALGLLSALGFIPGAIEGLPSQFLSVGYGTWTANGATGVDVVDANITATSLIFPALLTVGGTVGAIPAVQTKTAGTGFNIKGTASDTSVYAYIRIG